MEEKKFNVDFCDLTNENEKVEFLKGIFGERLYKALTEKRGFKFEVGQLYRACYEDSLDNMKCGHKEVEIGNNYKRTVIPSPYIVGNLPSGTWEVILPNKYNIPEHAVDIWAVGTLNWDAKTGDFFFDGKLIDSDDATVIREVNYDGNINRNSDSFWYCEHIVIAWKRGKDLNRVWQTDGLKAYMLSKFFSECMSEFIESVEDD